MVIQWNESKEQIKGPLSHLITFTKDIGLHYKGYLITSQITWKIYLSNYTHKLQNVHSITAVLSIESSLGNLHLQYININYKFSMQTSIPNQVSIVNHIFLMLHTYAHIIGKLISSENTDLLIQRRYLIECILIGFIEAVMNTSLTLTSCRCFLGSRADTGSTSIVPVMALK